MKRIKIQILKIEFIRAVRLYDYSGDAWDESDFDSVDEFENELDQINAPIGVLVIFRYSRAIFNLLTLLVFKYLL